MQEGQDMPKDEEGMDEDVDIITEIPPRGDRERGRNRAKGKGRGRGRGAQDQDQDHSYPGGPVRGAKKSGRGGGSGQPRQGSHSGSFEHGYNLRHPR